MKNIVLGRKMTSDSGGTAVGDILLLFQVISITLWTFHIPFADIQTWSDQKIKFRLTWNFSNIQYFLRFNLFSFMLIHLMVKTKTFLANSYFVG